MEVSSQLDGGEQSAPGPTTITVWKATLVPTEEKAWWAIDLDWMFYKRAKSPALLEGDT
jgi:hypothetical protein